MDQKSEKWRLGVARGGPAGDLSCQRQYTCTGPLEEEVAKVEPSLGRQVAVRHMFHRAGCLFGELFSFRLYAGDLLL